MEHHIGVLVLVFVILSLLLGAFVRHWLKNTKIPYSVALLIIGLAIGLGERVFSVDSENAFSQSIQLIADIDPHLILFIFLPTLIFESAFAIETHLFKRTFPQITTLAIPGLIISTLLTAALVKYAFPWDWSWPIALMFGALVSATDPVAVVSLLKEMSSRKRLETLIEGESLLNDGTAIVLFSVFLGFVFATNEQAFSFWQVSYDFVRVVALGFMVGLVIALLMIFWIDRVFNDPMIEITLSVVAAYLSFYIAEELLHVSGVVAIVTLGISLASIGRTRISPEVAGFLHHFWEMMAYIANTIIFLLVGIIIAVRIQLDSTEAWQALGILYLGVLVIRAISIVSLVPVLKRIGIGMSKEKIIVMIWGGLRGAVALALALSVAQNSLFPREIGGQILFLCAGIVVLTIVINGSTVRYLLQKLGLSELPPAKQATVDKAEANIQSELIKTSQALKQDTSLAQADWKSIDEFHLINQEKSVAEQKATDEKYEVNADLSNDELLTAYKRRLLESERKYYWTQFSDGTLTAHGVNALVDAIESALDGEPVIYPREKLNKYWTLPALAEWLLQSPVMKPFFNRWSMKRLSLTYDIARGFLQAQQESLKQLKKLAPDESIEKTISDELENNCNQTREKINELQQKYPLITQKLETYIANRLLLNQRRKTISNLAHSGVLDAPEAERLTSGVEREMEALAKQK